MDKVTRGEAGKKCKGANAAKPRAKVSAAEPRGGTWARGHGGTGEAEKKCKGANAAKPRAKVQKWETKFRVAGGGKGRGVRPARPRMTGPVIPTKDRSIHSGFRFPFEWVNRFGWRMAAPGLGWREIVSGGRADHPWSAAVERGSSILPKAKVSHNNPRYRRADATQSRPCPNQGATRSARSAGPTKGRERMRCHRNPIWR